MCTKLGITYPLHECNNVVISLIYSQSNFLQMLHPLSEGTTFHTWIKRSLYDYIYILYILSSFSPIYYSVSLSEWGSKIIHIQIFAFTILVWLLQNSFIKYRFTTSLQVTAKLFYVRALALGSKSIDLWATYICFINLTLKLNGRYGNGIKTRFYYEINGQNSLYSGLNYIIICLTFSLLGSTANRKTSCQTFGFPSTRNECQTCSK